jgi:hypothetical protein
VNAADASTDELVDELQFLSRTKPVPSSALKASALKAAIGLVLLSLSLPTSGNAREIEIGSAVICDTQQQAERLGSLMHGDARNALSVVNAEENETACGVASLAYLRGSNLATVRTKDGTFQIAEIMVVGVITETGIQAVRPNFYFSVFKIDERIA